MTLPAHRFEDRKKKDKHKGKRVWTFDYDGTITGAPDRLSRIAEGLKAQGDTIVVLTGNAMARKDLLDTLDDFGFPYDEVIQYHDDESNGVSRAEYLKKLNAWGAFDNRIDRAVIFAPICPHLYLVVEPSKDDEAAAAKADAKQSAKEAAKSAGLRSIERRGYACPPPNLRPSDSKDDQGHEMECGTCRMYDNGLCWGYGLRDQQFPTYGEWVCDSWELDPNWQAQDAAQDAADDVTD